MNTKLFLKVFDVLGVSIFSFCILSLNASALDIGFGNVGEGGLQFLDLDLTSFLHNSEPLFSSGIPILLIVCGIKLGFRLFRKFIK